jgi:predicted RNA-binding Zn-ribbon protein involved in translation (DUF1610 family)
MIQKSTEGVAEMEEKDRNACCICGNRIVDREEREAVLCPNCEDTWRREVDCPW